MTPDHSALIERLEAGERGNELDVLVEVATFEPDDVFASCRANNAGTKVIYTRHTGEESSHLAYDWTLDPAICVKHLRLPLPSAPNQAKEAGE